MQPKKTNSNPNKFDTPHHATRTSHPEQPCPAPTQPKLMLHKELYEMCEDALTQEKPFDIVKLNLEIKRKCEHHYQDQIKPYITSKELKIILDRTFNLFDCFVINLKKSTDDGMQAIGEVFEKYTYRKDFMKHKQTAEIYNDL